MNGVDKMKICPLCGCECENEARFCPRDGSVLPSDSFVGRVLMGQFEILEEVGHGATGKVFKARQSTMDRIVAVKFLKQEYSSEPSVVLRFQREAKASARLMHPYIITVYLVGRTEEGLPYLVMEYLEGEDLDAVCKKTGAMPLDQVVLIGRQIADALAEAHSNDVVHRDLKPANIKLCERRREGLCVKVLDFGIAKILEDDQGRESRLTKTGTVFGTPYYLSPEQAAGDEVDHRADLYSLGVILYQMATGRVPFDSKSGLEVLVHHIRNEPPKPRKFRSEIPPRLEAVILKCLEKKRENRFATADELVSALKLIEEKEPALSKSGSAPRTGATLDMTGWNKRPEKTGSETPDAEGVENQKGTVLGMGGVDPALAEAAGGMHGKQENIVGEEPATDSVTGKVTLFSDRPEKRVVPAPARYIPPPDGSEFSMPGSNPGEGSPVQPAWVPEATPDPIERPEGWGNSGVENRSPSMPGSDGAGFKDDGGSGREAERSGWGGEKVDTFESEFEMSHFGKGRSVALIVSIVLLAMGALAAGGYFLFRDRSIQKQSTGKDNVEKEIAQSDEQNKERNGDKEEETLRLAAPVTRGVTLAEGQRSGRVLLEGLEVSLLVEGELHPDGNAQLKIELRKSEGGEAEERPTVLFQMVDPLGEVQSLDSVKENSAYRTEVNWTSVGLHRIVVSCGDPAGDPSTAWFAVPISKTPSRRIARDDSVRWNTPEDMERKKEKRVSPTQRAKRRAPVTPRKDRGPVFDVLEGPRPKERQRTPFDDLPEPPDKPEPRPGTRKDELPPPPPDLTW